MIIIKIIKSVILLFLLIFTASTLYYIFYEFELTYAIGLLSVSIAILSIFLAYCSDRRMKVLTKAAYNSNYSAFNERRLDLREKLEKYQSLVNSGANRQQIQQAKNDYLIFHSFSIWRCYKLLRDALDFQEFFDRAEKNQLIHEVDCLFMDLGNGKLTLSIIILDNYKKQLQNMYELISGIDIFNEDEERAQRIEYNLAFLKDEGATTVIGF